MIIKACPGHPLLLGRLGENLAREIVFVDEVAAWLSEYPNAAIGLLNQRPGDTQGYPVARAVVSGGALHWTVTNTDLSAEGNGRCELVATDNGVVVKSAIYDTIILTALDGSGETPEPWEDWREYFVELKDEAEGSASAAAGSATAAGQSATQAGQSAEAAEQSAEDAQEAAEGAAGSATQAGQSAANAASSAASASADAAAAAEARADAQTDAAAASESADNARDAAQAAEGSASAAAGSAAAATASEGNAAGSASAAAQSATHAAGSASGAANSATAAAQSASAAAASATAAAASEAAAREAAAASRADYTELAGEVSDLSDEVADKYEKPATGIPASDLAAGVVPSVPVQDVQVNGTSVLDAQGVANVPIAANNTYGVIKNDAIRGIGIDSDGRLYTMSAGNTDTRNGNSPYLSITPSNQHAASFYGFPKAAGDTTQSASSNPVGTYTDNAKDKIQQMLGVIEMIAPHEGAQAANAYSVGGAFCHAGKLYKATVAIAIGDAIVPGTNCTQTNLIELIGGI